MPLADRNARDYVPPPPRSAKVPLQFGPHFDRHPLRLVLLRVLLTLAVVSLFALAFIVFVWDSSTDERYAITVSNQTGEEIKLAYSLAWDVTSDGTLNPAIEFENATHRLDVDTCLIVPIEPDTSGGRPRVIQIERVRVNGEQVTFECSANLQLRPGESKTYRAAWDNADRTRGRESALHRITGLQNAGKRVIDLSWSELLAADFSIVFTEETPYE